MLTNFFQMLHQVNVGLAFSNLKVWASKISSISQKFALAFHCQTLNANVIFSFLWRQLTKDRLSMNNETLERILQFRFGTGDYSIEQYDHAIDLFLTEYPDETVRKKRRQPDGDNYPSKRKKATNVQSKPSSLTEISEALQQATAIDKIDLVDISSSDSEDNDQENIDVSESENCSNVESASSSNESDSDTD